jgi:hypothetical protein
MSLTQIVQEEENLHMKKRITWIVSLLALAAIHSAIAAPPHGRANILHCGCVLDATSGDPAMAFVNVNTSSKAKGHARHGESSIDSCYDGVDSFVDFQRTADDCQIDGAELAGLAQCSSEQAGNPCGEQVLE